MTPHGVISCQVISCQVISIQLCYSIMSFVLYWPPIGVLDYQLRYGNVKLCNIWCIIHTFLLLFNRSISTFQDKKTKSLFQSYWPVNELLLEFSLNFILNLPSNIVCDRALRLFRFRPVLLRKQIKTCPLGPPNFLKK